MREASAVTARDTARLLGVDPAKVSHIESGRMGVSEERLRRLAAFYDCDDTALVDALATMTGEHRGRGWWEEYRGILPAPLRDLSELEHHATFLRSLQITHIPGLLQTENYARTIFGYVVPQLPERELESLVQHRMKRQTILSREEPPPYESIIHEAALRMRFGGREVVRQQLAHLLTASEAPHLSVRIFPFASGGPIGSGDAMLLIGGPVPQLDTVQVDAVQSATFLDAGPHLNKFRAIFDIARKEALSETRSRDFLRTVMQEL